MDGLGLCDCKRRWALLGKTGSWLGHGLCFSIKHAVSDCTRTEHGERMRAERDGGRWLWI